jgi:molecular chaperone GrpE
MSEKTDQDRVTEERQEAEGLSDSQSSKATDSVAEAASQTAAASHGNSEASPGPDETEAEARPEEESATVEQLKARLAEAEARAEAAEKKAAEYLDDAQRLKAEFENYRKRMLREQTHHIESASRRLVESLLPVLDAFDLAMKSLEELRKSHHGVVEGIELVYANLLGTLAKEGVHRIDEAGIPFDTHLHQAIEHEGTRTDDSEEYVVAVLRPGYSMGRRVLRPADVKVGYRPKHEAGQPSQGAGENKA